MNRCPGHSGVVILQSLQADCVTCKPKSICDFLKTERQVSIQALEAAKGTMNLPSRSQAVTKCVFAVGWILSKQSNAVGIERSWEYGFECIGSIELSVPEAWSQVHLLHIGI